jgi:hypothetical protein
MLMMCSVGVGADAFQNLDGQSPEIVHLANGQKPQRLIAVEATKGLR